MSDRKIFKLNDEFIAQLQNLVSLAVLSGTPIADHLRQVRLEASKNEGSTLVLTPEYLEYHNSTVSKLTEEVEKNIATQQLVDTDETRN